MKSLLALKKKELPEDLLKYHLHKYLAKTEPARSHKRVHASDITKQDPVFCPREIALLDVLGEKREDVFLGTSTNVTFQIGRDVQDFVVNCFADLDQAVGNWICRNCHTLHPFCKRPTACGNCSKK